MRQVQKTYLNNTSSSEVGIWSIETTHIHCEYETDKQLVEKRVVAAYCDDCSPLMRDLLSEIFSPWVDTNCDGESVDVYLGDIGDNKIRVIKALREITHLDLLEAKTLVESETPFIAKSVQKEEGWGIKEHIESAGGFVSLSCADCDQEVS